MEGVVAAEQVMSQSLFDGKEGAAASPTEAAARARDRLLFALAVAALMVSLVALGVALGR